MIAARLLGSPARHVLGTVAATAPLARAMPTRQSTGLLMHRNYASSKSRSTPPKPKVVSRRITPRSPVLAAPAQPVVPPQAPVDPLAPSTPPTGSGAVPQPLDTANVTKNVIPEASASAVSPLSTALAPAQGLMDKARAFFNKYKSGLRVLVKEDIPRYRQLKNTPMADLSRRDAVFVERVRHDMKILAPFGVFLILLPEVIPLLVIKGLVPSTCIDRDDRAKAWTKQVAVREKTAGALWAALSSPRSKVNPQVLLAYDSVRNLALRDPSDFQMGLLQYSQHKFMLTYFGLSPYFPYPYPLAGRVTGYLKDLERDDWRLRTESNAIQGLTDDELALACEVRGIPTVASPASGARQPGRARLERELDLWVKMNTDTQIPKALVAFARIVQTAKLVRDHGGSPLMR